MKIKVALICGVSDQDGTYLAALLLKKGYEVWGTSRDSDRDIFLGLKSLGVFSKIKILTMIPTDYRSVYMALQ